MSPRKATYPHVVIENVRPELDCGLHPIKRTLGERVLVSADIYKDGHDLLAARILFRPVASKTWRSAGLVYEFNPDRWFGEFRPDALGRWAYTIEAWPDTLATWRSDLRKRVDAGQDVALDFMEGAALLRAAAKRAPGALGRRLPAAVRTLEDENAPMSERLAVALDDLAFDAIQGPLDPDALTRWERELEVLVDRERAAVGAWYELFPRSQSAEPGTHGTLADTARRLPEIAEMGFDVAYLPPIHPIGRTHRKGRNNTQPASADDPGSPWAIGSEEGGHTAIHPQLGTLDDFDALVAAAGALGMEIALDYALQCSPDHPWVKEHPDWFFRRPDGSIHYAENPPKKYEDIYPLDFWCADRERLWNACRDVLLFWIGHGVKIFRVDNPHTKPFAFWQSCLGEVQRRHPDTLFLAEAFTRPNRLEGLAKLGFNQSYTYFTWRTSAWDLTQYVGELAGSETAEYLRPNFFTNTPDILHESLQTGGRAMFRIRLVLAATLSPSYGIYSGYELCESTALRAGSEEYLNSEKYEVRTRDWSAPGHIKDDVTSLNRLRREHPALRRLSNIRFVAATNGNLLAYHKSAPGDELLVIVNLDPHSMQEASVAVPIEGLGIRDDESYQVTDLLTGERYAWRGRDNYVRLDPRERVAHVLRLPARRPAEADA